MMAPRRHTLPLAPLLRAYAEAGPPSADALGDLPDLGRARAKRGKLSLPVWWTLGVGAFFLSCVEIALRLWLPRYSMAYLMNTLVEGIEPAEQGGRVVSFDREQGGRPRAQGLPPFVGVDRGRGLKTLQDNVEAVAVDPLRADRRPARTFGPVAEPELRAAGHEERRSFVSRGQLGPQRGDAPEWRQDLLVQAERGLDQSGQCGRR